VQLPSSSSFVSSLIAEVSSIWSSSFIVLANVLGHTLVLFTRTFLSLLFLLSSFREYYLVFSLFVFRDLLRPFLSSSVGNLAVASSGRLDVLGAIHLLFWFHLIFFTFHLFWLF
jgi:hypothetical protein